MRQKTYIEIKIEISICWLLRKRKLKYEGSKVDENGQEIWTLRVTGQDRFEKVVNPHLSEGQIEQLSGQMGQILQVDF